MATLALPLPPRQSRALAVGLLALAVLLGLALLLAPILLLHRHYDMAIEALHGRIEVYRRVAAQAPELKKALDGLRVMDGHRFFLRNTAVNLAGAELQDLVRGAIENNGGRITTIQTSQPRDDGRFRQIGINVQLFATTPNLQKILYALETQTPYTLKSLGGNWLDIGITVTGTVTHYMQLVPRGALTPDEATQQLGCKFPTGFPVSALPGYFGFQGSAAQGSRMLLEKVVVFGDYTQHTSQTVERLGVDSCF